MPLRCPPVLADGMLQTHIEHVGTHMGACDEQQGLATEQSLSSCEQSQLSPAKGLEGLL